MSAVSLQAVFYGKSQSGVQEKVTDRAGLVLLFFSVFFGLVDVGMRGCTQNFSKHDEKRLR